MIPEPKVCRVKPEYLWKQHKTWQKKVKWCVFIGKRSPWRHFTALWITIYFTIMCALILKDILVCGWFSSCSGWEPCCHGTSSWLLQWYLKDVLLTTNFVFQTTSLYYWRVFFFCCSTLPVVWKTHHSIHQPIKQTQRVNLEASWRQSLTTWWRCVLWCHC